MKRIYLSALMFTLMCATVVGQQLILSDDSITITGSADRYEHIAHASITNNTSSTVLVEWLRTVNSLPSEWASAVCDGNRCYLETQDMPTIPDTVEPGEETTFDVHFYPNDVAGTGTVRVKAWIVGDTTTAVTGTFKLVADVSSAAPVIQDNKKIRIYPNPAKDYILIKNLPEREVSTVEVYNIFGRRMLSFSQSAYSSPDGVQRFDINTLTKGIYMIRVFDAHMNVIYTESLSKE